MLICMRTTLNLDDSLMMALKQHASRTGRTMTEIVDLALRELMTRESRPATGYRMKWVSVRGSGHPSVDLTDRDALIERMEGRE